MYVIAFRLPQPEIRKLLAPPVWSDSQYICTLSDEDRHLGHIVEDLGWHAYDAIHLNNKQDGLRYLGHFEDAAEAKRAVEASTGYSTSRTMSMNGGILPS